MQTLPRQALTLVAAIGLLMWGALPALAHGEEGEADSVNQVEQALAIVVNTPGATGEALERIEVALEDGSGAVDLVALEVAATALEEGRLHDAEDALIEALGFDPHAPADEPGAAADESGIDAAPLAEHGLTNRIEAGFRTPAFGDWAAIIVAAGAAGAGAVLIRRKGAVR